MRLKSAVTVLQVARSLAGSAEGMTLDEICQEFGLERRTAERIRDAIEQVFPQLEPIQDGRKKRFRIPGGVGGFFRHPSAAELAELSKVISHLRSQKAHARAGLLAELERKVKATFKQSALNKVAPDLEALLSAEMIAVQAGPRPEEDPQILIAVREALLAEKLMSFVYFGGSKPGTRRSVIPYGIIFGHTNFLIGGYPGNDKPLNFRLDKIQEIQILDEAARPPKNFNLNEFANRSFGFYQSEQEDVVLRVLPHGMQEFDRWRFHRDQTVERLDDGSAVVRFRCSGMNELMWHLFSWGSKIEIVAPTSLRELMATELRVALSRHEEEPSYRQQVGGSKKK